MSDSTLTQVSERETDVIVRQRRELAEGVVELTLAPSEGASLPAWTPGAHIDLILPNGIVRQYSLCSSMSDLDAYRVAVLKAPNSRGGSDAVHALPEGANLRIRGPRNSFPMARAKRYIFIGGGIGITPLIPMLEATTAAGVPWELHYGGRSRDSMAYLTELERLSGSVNLVPQDEAGILDLETILGNPQEGVGVYCCGPEPLLAAVEEACKKWPSGTLHLERFSAKEIDTEGDTEFEIVLQRSGVTATVGAKESVFEAMRAAGVSVLGSCLEGICGTCETGVLEGEIDHRDAVLDADEQAAMDTMMVCVSRCRGNRLVLDA